jgi:alpha-ketoglutarate-dependent taurine dioxygenase
VSTDSTLAKSTTATKPSRSLSAKPLKTMQVSGTDLVRETTIKEGDPLPLVIEAARDSLDLAEWVSAHRPRLMQKLLEHGGLLFRGFAVDSPEKFADVARALTPNLLDYLERAAARSEVAPKVFTSTELSADQWIPHHHEMSYSHNWPTRIYFYCDIPSKEGGCTPVASERRFFQQLDPAIKKRFIERKVMYVRNYGEGLDLSWQQAFQTEDRAVAEQYCRDWNVDFEWTEGNRLRTRQIRQAIAKHPETGETVWFNHAHMFHESNLQPEIREVLLSTFGSDGMPRNAYFGDGTPIETAMLDEIRAGYQECSVVFPWRKGDVMLLDNFLVVHAREPFKGTRRILVAMSDLYVNDEVKLRKLS